MDAPKSPTPSGFAGDEDLSHLLSAVSDDDAPEDQREPQSPSPDQALNELLEAIEGETGSGPSANAGSRAATAPEAPPGENVPQFRRPEETERADEPAITGRSDGDRAGESAAQIGHKASVGKPGTDRTSRISSEDTLSAGLAEAITDSTERPADTRGSTTSLAAWWVYVHVVRALTVNALDRGSEALDRLHPRARDGIGVVGIALLAIAFGLFLAQLLGWI